MADAAQPSLIGRTIDYILGRNTLIGIASFMLLIISGYATWHGMRDFIVGVSSTPTAPTTGGISISNDVLVVAVVIAFAKRRLRERIITFPLYVFLAIWSIGFGYGFWWSLISARRRRKQALPDCRRMHATPAPPWPRGSTPFVVSSIASSPGPTAR